MMGPTAPISFTKRFALLSDASKRQRENDLPAQEPESFLIAMSEDEN